MILSHNSSPGAGLNLESDTAQSTRPTLPARRDHSAVRKVSPENWRSVKVSNVHGNIIDQTSLGVTPPPSKQMFPSGIADRANITSSHCHINLNNIAGDMIQDRTLNIDASMFKGALTVQDDSHGSITRAESAVR